MKNTSFLRSVKYKCSKWANICEPNEVISEAYIIGQQLILDGESIPNIEAWMRTTTWNLIRNSSRKHQREQKKYKSLSSPVSNSSDIELKDILPSKEEPNNVYTLADKQAAEREKRKKHNRISKALETLNTEDQEILKLKLVEELSWQEIAQRLCSGQKLASLRQKGSRAKKKLEKAYRNLERQN